METRMRQLLFWSPRVLTPIFAVFLSLFALDVFEEGYGFWDTVVALFMHLIPSLDPAGMLSFWRAKLAPP
jgi:hypothetical protein